MPYDCVYPFAPSHALYRWTSPFGPYLIIKTHLHPIIFRCSVRVRCTSVQTSFFQIDASSSWYACSHCLRCGESIASSQVRGTSMDEVACATVACPLLVPVCSDLCDCSSWNRGVLNMPVFFRELCLLHGATTALVASSSTVVLGAGVLTVIELRVSS
jgi:hypothetical protein